MLKTLKTLVLSAVIGAGALAAVPAHADSLYFSFGDRNGHVGVGIGDRQVRHWDRDRYERRHERRHERRDWRQARQGCSAERAVNKAYRMGIDRVRVADVGRNTITIRGRDRGHRVHVTFARAPGCPVIG